MFRYGLIVSRTRVLMLLGSIVRRLFSANDEEMPDYLRSRPLCHVHVAFVIL